MHRYFFKKLSRILPFVALAILSVAPAAWSQESPAATPEAVGMSAAKLARIGPTVEALIQKNQLAGAVIMVARHGKIVYYEAFGNIDAASGQPMKRDAIMRFYSMLLDQSIKPLVYAAITD